MNYEDALERIKAIQTRGGEEVNSLCRCEFMTHGHRTQRVILFLHGYTNCPRQFYDLGLSFFQRGYNVFNARLPHHGFANRLTPAIGRLTAQDLIDCANEVIDIGCGLGEHITISGISAGAVAAAWAAQHRAEVDQAVIIAPSFAISLIPSFLIRPFAELGSRLPALLIWWDFAKREKTVPDYAYPRFATRSLAQIIRLGLAVKDAAQKSKPLAGKIILVTNASDPAVDNRAAHAIANAWERHGANVTRYEFAADLKMVHDIIDPHQPVQRVDTVYPKLIELTDL